MNLRDLKSLNSTISEVTKPETQDKSRMIQEGFGNSLTAKARQVVNEEKESAATEKAEGPKHDAAEMKKMMAKALKRAKKKARLVKEDRLAEVAAPGYEDWASNPKVKARFKERYGKRWKQVMYGHSWNMKAKGLAESEQLDEAGYKRLMRIKKAAYKANLASRKMNPKTPKEDNQLNRLLIKQGKLGRAAAERTAQVVAGFARRGGASADAIRGGGSIIGKSGKYTQKAATLAKQRDKGLANFRNLVVDRGVSRDTGVGPVKAMGDRLKYKKPQMTPDQVAKKRKDQAAMRDFRNRARSGDFGQNNQEGMRPRYNYLKRTGKLKTKTK